MSAACCRCSGRGRLDPRRRERAAPSDGFRVSGCAREGDSSVNSVLKRDSLSALYSVLGFVIRSTYRDSTTLRENDTALLGNLGVTKSAAPISLNPFYGRGAYTNGPGFDQPLSVTRWGMARQLREARFVLVVCTANYHRRVTGREAPGVGLGARWEGALITSTCTKREPQIHPGGLRARGPQEIPDFLRHTNHYDLSDKPLYEKLYRRLTGQPRAVRRPVGIVRRLPPEPSATSIQAPHVGRDQKESPASNRIVRGFELSWSEISLKVQL